MTTGLRRTAIAMFVLLGLVFVNLNVIQVFRADDLANDDRNSRTLIRDYDTRRGLILGAEQTTVLAESEETDGPLRFRRRYPQGGLFAHATGYHSVVYGRSEIEDAFNAELAGNTPEAFSRNLADFLAGRERTGDDVVTTLRPAVQQAAVQGLADQRGAVVALNPQSGAILGLASTPGFDPDRLASHDTSEAASYKQQLDTNPHKPLLNRAVREWHPPGSTFKLVTAAAGLASGMSPTRTFEDPTRLDLPQTEATIGNYGGGTCAGGGQISLAEALRVSCNTTFAQIGLDVGEQALIAQAEEFGFNAPLIEQLADPLVSRMPDELNRPQVAQAAIGEFDVRATPLQMALVAAAIGNNGTLPRPRIVKAVQDTSGAVLAEYGPSTLTPQGQSDAQALSPRAASTLRNMMTGVVESGTGTAAQLPDTSVAGKTGTAQMRQSEAGPTVWFAGFAPARDPRVAVAVLVEEGGNAGSDATGGGVAAPIARQVLAAALDSTP
jgi:peptidoglycan glycosyltransferase